MLIRKIKARNSPALLIEYVDGQGAATQRTILPIALLLPDTGKLSPQQSYLYARSEDGRGLRQFRLDRLGSIADPRTGESLDLSAWIDGLRLEKAEPWREAESEPAPTPLAATKASRLRLLALASLGGYLIGRLRLIPMLLRWLDVQSGRWL